MTNCMITRKLFLGLLLFVLMLPYSVTAASKQVKSTTSSPAVATDPTTGMEFVLVKGGCFMMGETADDAREDEKPAHRVCVDSFYLGKNVVTQGQWERVLEWNPSTFKECGPNCPVENVSWNDVQDFISRLNAKSARKFRLPTEAEWEYAARSGGKRERFSGGNKPETLAWFDENSDKSTHPVGQKRPNGLGLYDMSGNVWEWVNDWYDAKYYGSSPKKNPPGPATGTSRDLRGGSWGDDDWFARTTTRSSKDPRFGNSQTGFRLIMTPR